MLWQRDCVLDRLRQFSTGRGLVFAPWVLLAAGDLFAVALRDQDAAFRTTVSVGLWLSWAAVLVVLVAPGAVALTLARTAVPAAVPATLWANQSLADSSDRLHLATIGVAVLATVAVLLPRVGERFVDAASYGDERRYLLRAPAVVLWGPMLPTWAVAAAGITAGPIALAAQRWVLGAILIVAGTPPALLALRALVRLAQRWLVFVPAGLVVRDHVAIAEPVLISRGSISHIGPARADTKALDLTARAAGLALEVSLSGPIELALPRARSTPEQRSTSELLVSPTRPAAVLGEAGRRRIPIG